MKRSLFGLLCWSVVCCASLTQQPGFFSEACQDRFVYTLLYKVLHKEDPGYYLEIGCWHPIENNNSYVFEHFCGWKGISLDHAKWIPAVWYRERNNQIAIADARSYDYRSALASFPRVLDYLSLDIDADYDVVLQKIPFDHHVFRVITIEHDAYRYGDLYRTKERAILQALGYYLLCPDVPVVYFKEAYYPFEDWWIHPDGFPEDLFRVLTTIDFSGKRTHEICEILEEWAAMYR